MEKTINNLSYNNKIHKVDTFDDEIYQKNLKGINQLEDDQDKVQELKSIKLKLILSLEEFGVKKEDFELVNKDGIFVIVSNSSYFSSIVGLNGIQEKEKSRDSKDRDKYDTFDGKLKDLFNSNISKSEARIQLKEYCKGNNLDFESIIAGGGCVISEGGPSFVGIKRTIGSSKSVLEEIEENKGTIAHEGQHIKFNDYCREKLIEQNGNLKILNEVIAHCTNTKNDEGVIIDFEKIFETMKDNENYKSVSGIEDKTRYESVLKGLIGQVKKEMENKDKNIDDIMKYLIEQNN